MENLRARLTFNFNNEWINGSLEALVLILLYLGFLSLNKSVVQKLMKKLLDKLKISTEESLLVQVDQFLKRIFLLFIIGFIAASFPLPVKIQSGIQDGLFVAKSILILLFSFDLIDHIGNNLGSKGAAEFKPLLSKIFKTLFTCFAVMTVMRHFNYDIWHIVTALGIGSLAVGLAAQPTLSNMIAGFTLLIDRPFRPDDHIQISGGSEGDVLHIGMRSTWIKTNEGNVLIVPNSELVSTRLINFNYPDSGIFQKIKFQFEVDQDIDSIKRTISGAAEAVQEALPDSRKILCSAIIDGKIELTLVYKIALFSTADAIRDKMISAALVALNNGKLRVAGPNYIVAARPEQKSI